MSLACTPVPVVVTSTLPEASRVSRSPALSSALLAVGEQMPFAQDIFCVASDEIVTLAIAPLAGNKTAAHAAPRISPLATWRTTAREFALDIGLPRRRNRDQN